MSKGAYVYLSYYITLFVKNSFIKLWLTEQKNKSTPNGVAHLNTETFDAFNFKDRQLHYDFVHVSRFYLNKCLLFILGR